ncbi:MAG: TatD family hydrolase [Treponema sp.]|nr:TatD family hydrolase [Treponema sp.]
MTIPALPRIIDTHAHLSMLDEFNARFNARKEGSSAFVGAETLIQGLFDSGLGGIIDIGTQADDLPERIAAFSRFERVRFSAGLWPDPENIARRRELVPHLERNIAAAKPGLVVAVGECGLDHHQNLPTGTELDKTGEQELFEMLLDLAEKRNLPIIIHSRDAPEATAAILAGFPGVRGVIHCFSYGAAEARTFLDLGYYISFAGNLTYKSARNLREALCFVPPDRLLLETDSPFLAPVPHRGKPSHPGMVAENYALAAELRRVSLPYLTAEVSGNAVNLFACAWF